MANAMRPGASGKRAVLQCGEASRSLGLASFALYDLDAVRALAGIEQHQEIGADRAAGMFAAHALPFRPLHLFNLDSKAPRGPG